MRLLLDTHVAIWSIADSPELSSAARALLEAPESEVWISAASLWEISIKHALGPKRSRAMPVSARDARDYFLKAGARILPIQADHAIAAGELPPLHADPFDRMLAAQALVEPMRLVTHDVQVAAYSDTFIRV